MYTLEDIKEYVKKFDEVYFLEYFGITTEDLISRFEDLIEERADDLEAEISQEI